MRSPRSRSPWPRRAPPRLLVLIGVSLAAACNLLPAPGNVPRYFEPGETVADTVSKTQPSAALRLRRVTAASHLRERLVWRRGVELGFHEDRRWTEAPATYAERRLVRTLFGEHVLISVEGGAVPLLDVEVIAFEELLDAPRRARVELRGTLLDAQLRTLRHVEAAAEVSLDADDPVQLAEAVGRALDQAVRLLARRTMEAMAG